MKMKLKYKLISRVELSSPERYLLAYRNEDFAVIYYNGIVKINSALPAVEQLVKLAEAMWEIDYPMDEEQDDRMEGLYTQVVALSGKDVALQLYHAWSEAGKAALKAADRAAAIMWLNDVYFKVDFDEREGTVALNTGFMNAIREVIQENEKLWCTKFRTAADVYRDALFVYAYNCGVAAATGENM